MILTPDKKLAGVLAPLFALRGENDLGIGDVGTLREFVDWAADAGFGVVQLLPINETGHDNSPYNAISSAALDPATIEIAAVADLTPADFAELTAGVDLAALRAGAVNYPLVKSLKRSLLRRAFETFTRTTWRSHGTRARRFNVFRKTHAAWLDSYALFRVLMEKNAGAERWDTWPAEQQTAAAAGAWLAGQPWTVQRDFEVETRFAKFIQWIAWEQWQAVKQHAEIRGVALMGDVPFGVSYYSADVFGSPELFDPRWSGGAPPEPLFRDDAFTCKWGQNWGVPLYDWDRMRADNFRWWRQRVRLVRDVFHLFRIDHILGFFRIYSFPWRPQRNAEFLPLTHDEAKTVTGGELPRFLPHDDETPENKATNRAQGEEFLRILVEETGEHRLIGEDLGTVPDYVRPSLAALGIPGFRIPIWDTTPAGGLVAAEDYDRLSVATYATHDHESLRAIWEHWMRIIQVAITHPVELGAARDHAWWAARRLAAWAGFEVPRITPFEEVHQPLLAALFRTNSWLAITLVTDLVASTQRFNIPGAVSDSNWSQRLAGTISDWRKDPALSSTLTAVRSMLDENGRLSEPVAAAGPSQKPPARIG